MSNKKNTNEQFCEEILYRLMDIENELAEYVENNITKNKKINDVYPYAFDKVREIDLMSNRPFGEIFTLLYIIANQDKFLKDMEEIKSYSKVAKDSATKK